MNMMTEQNEPKASTSCLSVSQWALMFYILDGFTPAVHLHRWKTCPCIFWIVSHCLLSFHRGRQWLCSGHGGRAAEVSRAHHGNGCWRLVLCGDWLHPWKWIRIISFHPLHWLMPINHTTSPVPVCDTEICCVVDVSVQWVPIAGSPVDLLCQLVLGGFWADRCHLSFPVST